MRYNGVFWGVILIVLGSLFLLSTLGILTASVWGLFWPILFIVLGVWILLGGARRRRGAWQTQQVAIPLGGATEAKVRLNYGVGQLTLSGGAATGMAISGTCYGGADVHTQQEGSATRIEMRIPSGNFSLPWASWGQGTYDWSLNLTREVPVALDLEMGACEARVDLTNTLVGSIHLSTGASRTDLVLPAGAGYTRVDLHSGVAAVYLHVPQGVAARIRTSGGLAGITVDTIRFPQSAGGYESPDYGTATNKVDIDAETGVGSLDIR